MDVDGRGGPRVAIYIEIYFFYYNTYTYYSLSLMATYPLSLMCMAMYVWLRMDIARARGLVQNFRNKNINDFEGLTFLFSNRNSLIISIRYKVF